MHHGLSPNADGWADFCQQVCLKLSIPFALSKVRLNKNSGLGTEATAREARYKALLSLDADFICLAHHQDDQAETLLLQLARGTSSKGRNSFPLISAMPAKPFTPAPRASCNNKVDRKSVV